jgi:RNA polymerase sigma factor (sigma-70 family)
MEVRGDDGEHSRKEETKHPMNRDNKGTPDSSVRANPTAEGIKEFIDNLELTVLEEEVTSYWTDPEFLKLVNDPGFRQEVHDACAWVIGRFKPSRVYTCDDLEQDVFIRFGKWFPKYRGEAQPKSLLRRIALNQLIDVSRNRENQAPSYDDIELECRELMHRRATTNRNHVADREDLKILIKELTSGLTHKQRLVFEAYCVRRSTTPEIAVELGITKQAVSKHLTQIRNKLRVAVNQPIFPGGNPVEVGINGRPI